MRTIILFGSLMALSVGTGPTTIGADPSVRLDGPVHVIEAEPALGRSNPAPTFTTPVDAAVIEGFDLSKGQYGAGNRGVLLDTSSGDIVRAMGGGAVTFNGVVAGVRWVTIRHDGDVLSSYGPLDSVVATGQPVGIGQMIGRASGPLHVGVRVGGIYVDPVPLWSVQRFRAVLDSVG